MSADNTPAGDTADGATAVAPAAAPVTAAAAARQTLLTRLRVAAYAVSGGMAASALVHLALVGTVLVLSPRLLQPESAKAVTVDLVTPDELDKAAEKAKDEAKPEPPAQPQIPDVKDTPQQQQQQQAQSPASPPQAASAVPPPSPLPPQQPTLDAFAPPLAPSAAPAPAPPPLAPTSRQASQLAQMLGLPEPVAGLSGGAPSEYKANLTSEEIAGFSSHLQSCWTPSPELAKAAKLTLYVRVRLRRDGGLAAPPELLGGSASMQAFTLKEMVMKALTKCPAYTALPAEKYDEWRVLDLHFTPSGISTASPAPSNSRGPKRAG